MYLNIIFMVRFLNPPPKKKAHIFMVLSIYICFKKRSMYYLFYASMHILFAIKCFFAYIFSALYFSTKSSHIGNKYKKKKKRFPFKIYPREREKILLWLVWCFSADNIILQNFFHTHTKIKPLKFFFII